MAKNKKEKIIDLLYSITHLSDRFVKNQGVFPSYSDKKTGKKGLSATQVDGIKRRHIESVYSKILKIYEADNE